MKENNNKLVKTLIAVSACLFIGIVIAVISLISSKNETEAVMQKKQEMEELVALEKEEMMVLIKVIVNQMMEILYY